MISSSEALADDTLNGGNDNDWLVGGAGNDTINGGGEIDLQVELR